MPSKPARKFAGMASSPCTSIAKSTPVSSIALRTQRTSGLFSADGRMPFAVEVHARGIGAQVPAPRPVRVHVRDDAERAFAAKHAGDRIVDVGQLFEGAFHPPFGHALARVLAGVEPDVEVALADGQAVDVLAVERLAERAIVDEGQRRVGRDQVVVPLHRIRREIGEPDAVGLGRQADGEDAIGIARLLDAQPFLAVGGNHGFVVWPAVRIGRAAAVQDPKLDLAVRPRRQGGSGTIGRSRTCDP